ncbi:MAG: 16S rRNA (adenine(1518)-N(6)/adenine(1519)-N(6))-dimethyltransferase RsmA [bacterium]|nr:16S rRNA (adenine(1518)-N(6)/adenine(1519)-N(6))-dimethyltransferase RsmA [bacterium]
MPQKLGQHFLKNKAVIQKIIASLDLQPGETVIEIGPGKGALTVPLSRACTDAGCTLVAIEKDSSLAAELAALKILGLEIITGDALEVIPQLASDYKLKAISYKLAGNIPYYITGHLLRVVSELEVKPSRTVLMIQKEVAERLTAKPGKMNLLAAATQIWADISIIAALKPEDFSPAPKVDSAVIRIETKKHKSIKASELATYYAFIHAAFKQPRKTLLNNLSEAAGRSKADMLPPLQQLGFTEKTRAQELSVDDLIKLATALREGE